MVVLLNFGKHVGDWYGITKGHIKFTNLYAAFLKYFEICNDFIEGTTSFETDGLHEYIIENIGSELLDNESFANFYTRDLRFQGNLNVMLCVPSERWPVLDFLLTYCPDTKKYIVSHGLDPDYNDFDEFLQQHKKNFSAIN